MTCNDCSHYDVCGGYTPTDLDQDVFDYCREGRADEIPDIENRCNNFKNKSDFVEVVRCKDCGMSRETEDERFLFCMQFADTVDCQAFCSYGERK